MKRLIRKSSKSTLISAGCPFNLILNDNESVSSLIYVDAPREFKDNINNYLVNVNNDFKSYMMSAFPDFTINDCKTFFRKDYLVFDIYVNDDDITYKNRFEVLFEIQKFIETIANSISEDNEMVIGDKIYSIEIEPSVTEEFATGSPTGKMPQPDSQYIY